MLTHLTKRFLREQTGAYFIDYLLVAVIISIVAFAAMRQIGETTSDNIAKAEEGFSGVNP